MKKLMIFVSVLLFLASLVGCTSKFNENSIEETGYPNGEIQQSQIMYNGQIYFYFATGFDEPLLDGYEYVGSVIVVDNVTEPEEDFHGARVELGQEIYADDSDPNTIYIKYENGYARFSVK